jgi:outer membrane protein
MHRSLRALTLASLLTASFGATVATSVVRADPPVKIAVVDMQRALHETEDGRKAKANLKKVFDERQKTLDKQQNDLKAMKDSLDKQHDVLSPAVLTKKQEELQKAFTELQQTYMEFQRELAAKEGELTKDIIERMQRIMRRVGQTEGYTLIMERNESGVLYVPSNYDLTDLLIQRYNSGEGKGESSAAPAPAAKAPAAKPAPAKTP